MPKKRKGQFSKQPREDRNLPPGYLLEEELTEEEVERPKDEVIIYETLPPLPKDKKERYTKNTSLGAIREVVEKYASSSIDYWE